MSFGKSVGMGLTDDLSADDPGQEVLWHSGSRDRLP